MDNRTGDIHTSFSLQEMAEEHARDMKFMQSLLQKEMTARQALTRRVSTHDHRSVLGVRLGKARNQPCPCGSGKKLKRCCGASGAVR